MTCSASTRIGVAAANRGQEAGGDRVELADVTEVNRRKNLPNVEGARTLVNSRSSRRDAAGP
jgi:hypothetical protein